MEQRFYMKFRVLPDGQVRMNEEIREEEKIYEAETEEQAKKILRKELPGANIVFLEVRKVTQ